MTRLETTAPVPYIQRSCANPRFYVKALIGPPSMCSPIGVMLQRLVKYIWGDNELERKIEMTSPVVTTVRLDADQRIRDDFTVSFFLPRE